ncbi:hypothetical protein KC19_1G131900 [Ceratodon purpureus]|uniref:Uncharacterized protein n=1 Tax=Ceratodon purpureus TaxID=3225 RepID=A0A8T0J6M4_CERPU|nr:hypothetical protein KC19_1G131900 [Ceratodon purpureus]
MRGQFHEGRNMWASEKAAILRDIEVLTENVQSRDIVIHDLRSQLKLLQQSLSHEENCRKLLEFQLADAKAGMESVSAEFLTAQSILESLRENSKTELSFLKDTLTEKDKQLKELHDKQKQIDRDQKELAQLEAELDSYKSNCEHLQQALENRAEQEMLAMEIIGAKGDDLEDSNLEEERENLLRRLGDAETTIAAKEVEMKELEMELDRTRTLAELLTTSLAEAEEKHLEGKSSLEQVTASLSVKQHRVMELETELERLRAVVNDVRECNTEAEARITLLEERLRDAQREMQAKNSLNQTLLDVHEHEEVVLAVRSECESLQRQLNTCETERCELEKHRDLLITESREKKQMYQKEKEDLLTKLEHLGKQCLLKDNQLNDLLDQIEREKQVISSMEARCSASEQELSKQLALVDHAREEVIVWKLNAQAYKERAQVLETSLSAEAAAKDSSLQEIKDSLLELTVLCKGGAQAATSQTLRISSIEEKLQQQDMLQGSMDGKLVSLLRELNAVVGEVERISQGVSHLNTELHSLEDNSKLTKSEFETRLRAVEGLFSSSCAELKEVSQQVRKMNAERLSLVSSLKTKGGDLVVLKGENQSLHAERSRLEANTNDLEERLLKLAREAENSKAIIDNLNENLKEAEVVMATRSGELHELHEKLEESESKSMQLLSVAEQARCLEDKLRETEAIVHDKEQRLAASEWTVQQLASEIAKSKSYLTRKEKDEVASKDRLSHLETQLREKERELMELHCDLENAVKTSNERYSVVQQLTCSMEELTHVLDLTKRALEERTATLAASETEIRRVLEVQRLTEEALETCKERLSNEVKTNVARENDMKRLCEDIESAKQESRLADVQVKDLQERLKCLERTTEARLESYERKVEKGSADLGEYKDNCAALLDLIEKKDALIHELESKVEHGRKELAKQVTLTEQGEQELESQTKMHSNLKVELATADDIIKELDLQKRGLEEELRGLKSSLSVATEAVREKAVEIEQQRRSIERLESLAAQQGEAHAVKAKELQITSNSVEELENKVARLQPALNKAQDDLQAAYELVSTKEGEKRTLTARLSEMESQVEKGKSQISQLQASLQLSRVNLEAETERVWLQVAARNEIETELDAWKAKAAAFTESNAKFESSISRLQAEVKEWKEIAEHTENLSQMELDAWKARVASLTETNATMTAEFKSSLKKSKVEMEEWKEIAENTQFLNAELEKSMQAVQESVTGWEKVVTSLADEGDVTKRHLDFLLKQVHEEFQCVQEDLANSKDLMSMACREGNALKSEFLTFARDSQLQVEALKEQKALDAITGTEEREQHLHAVISDLRRDLSAWEAKAMHSSATEFSLQEAQSQLKEWRQRAEECESFIAILEQAFLDFEHSLLECKSGVSSIDDIGRNMKLDIQLLFQNLRKEVEEAKSEMLELKEVAALEAKEARRVKLEIEDCVTALQAEVEVWKEKAAAATDEGLHMKVQFEELLKSLQGELKTWKQFETLAREERQSTKVESAPKEVARVVGVDGAEPDVFTPNSINPFHQEDEGCSSGLEAADNDDAAQQLHGWKSKSSTVAKEGRKLTRQFRASFKHIQFELESRKQAPKMSKHESFVHRHEDTGLEDLVRALQEEAVEVKADLAEWKSKAASAAQETATLKEDLEKTISKLKAEVEGWKDRSAMSAGQRIVARRQLDDYAKQVKSLSADVQKWKDVATEANEGSTKLQICLESVQKENEEVRTELNEWMQKALELNCRTKDLEADVENWKRRAETHNDENRLRVEELEHLRAEVEKWKTAAVTAEEEEKSARMDLLDTLGKFEDELEVMSSNSIGECSSAGGRSLREEELDCSTWQRSPSGRFSNEWRPVASELEISLQAEVEDWKRRVVCAEKEQEDMRERYETTVKELHLEVEAWKKSAACIAEDGRLERVELEKRLKGFLVKDRDTSEMLELKAELENWKARAADSAEECTTLRDTYENIIKELQLELAQWKEKSDAAAEEAKVVKANLENVVQDLEHQVRMWKQKAEKALEGVVKSQEYEDLIKALEEELCLWTQRTEEGKALQLQLEKDRAHLKESLTATQNELQKWKDKAAVVTTSIRSLQEDDDIDTELESQLQKWKSKANDGELLQEQLKNLLAETETELQEWKHKAAEFSLIAEALKEELVCIIDEGRLETEELSRSNSQLEAELCVRAQECQSLQSQLKTSQSQLQTWEEKAAAITQSTRSLMEEFDLTVEEGQLEKQEFYNSISTLKASVLVWKEKVAESESTQSELKRTLLETETELQAWKDRAAAVAIATKSLKEEIDSILSDNRLQKEKLCNTINELEAELFEWKSRAQEGVSVQLELERAMSEMEERAAAAASETQALKDELDSTITESSSEIQQLCTAITGVEAELSDLKGKVNDDNSPQLLQLQSSLTETQSQLKEWQERATVASQAEEELRQAVDEIRSQSQKLHDFSRALKDELLEWKKKADDLETLQLGLTSSLASSQEELQSWKQKAMDATLVTDSDLGNSISNLETELSQWKEKAQEGELLHQQMRNSLTETQTELQDMKEKISAFISTTHSLKDELRKANEQVNMLTIQLSTQKQNEVTLQTLNRQLEAELVLVREEALSRKHKMTQILTQLEGTSNSQKELQNKLHLAQHRLLGNDGHPSQAESANLAFSVDSDNISSPETPPLFMSHHQKSRSESPDYKTDISRGSVSNPAVEQLRQELSSMKFLVSKLEHVRGSDGEQSQASSVRGDEEKMGAAEEFQPRVSLQRENEELDMDVNGARRRDVPLQKQAASSSANHELVHPQRKPIDRSRSHNVARFKVLADVDGNSPRASANHDKVQQEGVCPPGTPDITPFSRLRRTASGV